MTVSCVPAPVAQLYRDVQGLAALYKAPKTMWRLARQGYRCCAAPIRYHVRRSDVPVWSARQVACGRTLQPWNTLRCVATNTTMGGHPWLYDHQAACEELVARSVSEVLAEAGCEHQGSRGVRAEDVSAVSRAHPSTGADFQTQAALMLTKHLRAPPKQVAERLIRRIEAIVSGEPSLSVAKVGVSGPGVCVCGAVCAGGAVFVWLQ